MPKLIIRICIYLKWSFPIRRQEEITAEKEEIDRQKKLLFKKRPVNSEGGGGRGKRTSSAAPSTPQPQPLHNGTDAPTFLKPDPLPSMTSQEYYEADEILKVSHHCTSTKGMCLMLGS